MGAYDGKRFLESFTFALNQLQDAARQFGALRRWITDINHSARGMRGREYKAAEIAIFGKDDSLVQARQFDNPLVRRPWRVFYHGDDIERRCAQFAHH